MSEEDLDDWDEECMNILLEVEEKTLSSFSSCSQPLQPLSQSSLRPPESRRTSVDYSPPRQLSHRSRRDDREVQIESLKSELGRVSKQLLDLEQECSKLRKEKDEKNEQLNNLSSINEGKESGLRLSKRENSDTECEALDNHIGVSRQPQKAVSCCKATGVQTDDGGAQTSFQDDIPTFQGLSNKLLDIWDSPYKQTMGRNIISNLLVTCQADLHELFGCMGTNISMKPRVGSPSCERSNVIPLCSLQACHSLETSKVSHFYSVMTKINNGMVHLEALLEPLLDLCSVENVVIIHRSLRILHEFLKHMFCIHRKSGERCKAGMLHADVLMNFDLIFQCNLLRDNVMVEGRYSGNNVLNSHGFEAARKTFSSFIGQEELPYAGDEPLSTKFLQRESLFEKRHWNPSVSNSDSCVDWVSLFEVMLQIAKREKEELVRVEAVSVMNIILLRSNAYSEREKYGNAEVFECISHMLRKESGLRVQKKSVQLLYLILNCPSLLVMFCCGCTEEKSTGLLNIDVDTSGIQIFLKILRGLVDCISCSGNGLEELELRRDAIVLLAFLASSGKSGFNILVSHKVPKDTYFLVLIMQVLASEIDIEATCIPKSPEIFKERTLLMREALILLNRLVSNPTYSATTLQILTKSRDMASLTIDIANRLSRKDQRNDYFDSAVGTTRKSEVIDLARVFKKRVFTYMGDHVS